MSIAQQVNDVFVRQRVREARIEAYRRKFPPIFAGISVDYHSAWHYAEATRKPHYTMRVRYENGGKGLLWCLIDSELGAMTAQYTDSGWAVRSMSTHVKSATRLTD